jgi:hypothetical protein
MSLKTSKIAQEISTTREAISSFCYKIIEPTLNFDTSSIFGKLSSISEDSFIEINETHIVTRRDGRGRILQGERYWIIGAICRETKQIRLELIRSRPAVLCENFVMSNIELGSNVISDMWRD